MRDKKNPGFFKAEREGTLKPVSPMFRLKEDYLITPGSGVIDVSNQWGHRYQHRVQGYFRPQGFEWDPPLPAVDPPYAHVLQEALSRAQTDAWDALTFAAEFRKTTEMVIGLRSRAEKLYDTFASRVAAKVKRTTKGVDISKIISEVWLEMRYGWRPLLFDIADINEAIRRLQMGVEDPLQRAYASDSSMSSDSRTFTEKRMLIGAANADFNSCSCSVRSTTSVEYKLHASVGLQVTTRETTLADPVVTAWELVPFSFILDWFITIGDMLAAFSPFATGQLRYSTISIETVQRQNSSFLVVPDPGIAVFENSMSPCVSERTVTTYSRRLENPTPTLAFKVNLDAFKILDLVALWLARNAKITKRILRHF
jgi:hypothetical protein